MKPPPSVTAAIEAIRRLPLPTREFEEALRRREADYKLAHAEHDKHGRVLQGWIARRLQDALGPRYFVASHRPRGYLVDWSYVAGQTRHRVPVRPYIHMTVYFPHGREVGPGTNAGKRSAHGDGRCTAELTYFPHSGEDAAEWVEKWAAWLKAAPAPRRAADLQVV